MLSYSLALRCRNRPGIVAAVAGAIASQGGDIAEAAQFDDARTGSFFMRIRFQLPEERLAAFRAPLPNLRKPSTSTGRCGRPTRSARCSSPYRASTIVSSTSSTA